MDTWKIVFQEEGTISAQALRHGSNEVGVKWAKGEIEEMVPEMQQNEYRASAEHNKFGFYCQ